MSVRTSLRVIPTPVQATKPTDRANVDIYRPFFIAGILTVLTTGCLLGAIALAGISMRGNYLASEWTPYVLAHANSQLFGWVGFFIIGFALQQHAPVQAKKEEFMKLAYATLGLLGLGIALRFVAEPLVNVNHSLGVQVGVASGVLQLIAVLLFHYNSSVNRYREAKPIGWQSSFVFGSLAWLTLVAAAEPVFFIQSHQIEPLMSVAFVARWFAPMREAQFLGFVGSMILGVSLTKFHSCMGFREATKAPGIAAFVLWTSGIIMRIVGWFSFFDANMELGADGTFRLSSLILFLGVLCYVYSLGVFEPVTQPSRVHKFLRSSIVWLLIAGVLQLFEPIHLRAIGAPFSHAYTGGIRHAVTVGFISQMIIGVGTFVITRLRVLDEKYEPSLWATFWLLNLGNLARVALEITTDYTHSAFGMMGFTGFVELTGLILWGMSLWRPLVLGKSSTRFAKQK